jgi:hypothetical protein
LSQLSRLIEQARKTRSVNDIFKFQPAAATSQEGEPPLDILLVRLSELESSLFDNPSLTTLPVEDLVSELEMIVRGL